MGRSEKIIAPYILSKMMVSAWWYTYPEKYETVSWDDDIPN
jgi:hypothetical protein